MVRGEMEMTPKIGAHSLHPLLKRGLRKMLRKHTYRPDATVRNCLDALCDFVFVTGPSLVEVNRT